MPCAYLGGAWAGIPVPTLRARSPRPQHLLPSVTCFNKPLKNVPVIKQFKYAENNVVTAYRFFLTRAG